MNTVFEIEPFVYEPEIQPGLSLAAEASRSVNKTIEGLTSSSAIRRRETIAGFPTYSRTVTMLPISERQKIDRLATFIIHNHNSAQPPIRTVRLIGHADMDTPRRPAFEHQVALGRAREVQVALERALGRAGEAGGRAPQPPWASRLFWKIESVGATQPVVPNPRSEPERARNRRVEIALIPYLGVPSTPSATRSGIRSQSVGQSSGLVTLTPTLSAVIDEFCARAPKDLNRDICVEAASNKMIELCQTGQKSDVICTTPVKGGRCYTARSNAQILDGIEYRAPFGPKLLCCEDNLSCTGQNLTLCAKCGTAAGAYAVLKYKPGPLKDMIDALTCRLDRGCAVRVAVMSGICFDKPDVSTCKIKDPKTQKYKVIEEKLRWMACWEHWLLVLGHDGDTFVFWDSARMSAFRRCGHEFGLLFYDSNQDRLSTAPLDPKINGLEVDPQGYHTQGYPRRQPPDVPGQKRYQVVAMFAGLGWRNATRSC